MAAGRSPVGACAPATGRCSRSRGHVAIQFLSGDPAAEESLELPQAVRVFVRHEADGVADRLRTPRPADPMHVVFGLRREVEVDDVRDAVHIDAARGDVGRDQHADVAGAEALERQQALALRAVRMQRRGRDAGGAQLARRCDPRRAWFAKRPAPIRARRPSAGERAPGPCRPARLRRRIASPLRPASSARRSQRAWATSILPSRRARSLSTSSPRTAASAATAASSRRSSGSPAGSPCRACDPLRRAPARCSAEKSTCRCSIRSISRPGVATTRSTPRRSAWICGPSPTPPKIVA